MAVRSRNRIPQAKASINSELDRFVFRVANSIRNEAVTAIMRGQKSGKVYGNHQASAPGEAPANDLGALVRNVRVEHQPGSLKARVVASG